MTSEILSRILPSFPKSTGYFSVVCKVRHNVYPHLPVRPFRACGVQTCVSTLFKSTGEDVVNNMMFLFYFCNH